MSGEDTIDINLEVFFSLKASNHEISKSLAPSSKLKYNYLMLDSDNAIEIPDTRDSFTWLINDTNPRYQQGNINLHSKLRNAKFMRLGRITFANAPTTLVDYLVARSRLGIEFVELNSQAVIDTNGVKFHFLSCLPVYDVNYGCTVVSTSFFQNTGYFRFRERFKFIDKLTIRLWNIFGAAKFAIPAVETSFPGFQMIGTVFTGLDDPFTWDYPISVANALTYIPHNALGNYFGYMCYGLEAVNISGFTTDDPVTDAALILAYNSTPINPVKFVSSTLIDYQVNPSGGTYFTSDPRPVTLTLIYKPRFTANLEIISEDSDDDEAL